MQGNIIYFKFLIIFNKIYIFFNDLSKDSFDNLIISKLHKNNILFINIQNLNFFNYKFDFKYYSII